MRSGGRWSRRDGALLARNDRGSRQGELQAPPAREALSFPAVEDCVVDAIATA